MSKQHPENRFDNVWAVVLAGGSGTRLWPLSREQFPKQFLAIDGPLSLLEDTLARIEAVISRDRVLIVSNSEHATGSGYRTLKNYQTILEPVGRNTAPAIAAAGAWIRNRAPDAIMAIFPSDQVVKDQAAFQQALDFAVAGARSGRLVTFGIRPTRPETGYGYIKTSGRTNLDGLQDVECFVEKPNAETATAYVTSGQYLWNAGMFVWQVKTLAEELQRFAPDISEVTRDIENDFSENRPHAVAIAEHFHRMPSISIDYAVLEKSSRVSVVPCDLGWSDVGSWDAVYELADKDENGNAVRGHSVVIDSKRNLIQGRDRLIAAVGVEDLVIVETDDAILVSRQGHGQKIKEVVTEIRQSGRTEHSVHRTTHRPWGTYTVLRENETGYKVKRIEVSPGSRLSLQSHKHRSEHWVVVTGIATVTCEDSVFEVKAGESTFIPAGKRHRLENKEGAPLVIVEVQVGEYVGEDDIVRYEDNYGRHTQKV